MLRAKEGQAEEHKPKPCCQPHWGKCELCQRSGAGGWLSVRLPGFKLPCCAQADHLTLWGYSFLIYEANSNTYFILDLNGFKKLNETMSIKYFATDLVHAKW